MTFTILGRDPVTGRIGAAATTSDIAVGARCLFAQAGVGVAVTQHRTDPRLGPLVLAQLRAGRDARAAVQAVADGTSDREWRQLAALDATGAAGTFDGALLWPASASLTAPDAVATGNMLAADGVVAAVLDAFRHAGGELGDRLLAALAAGLAAGGETGEAPLRSAALLIVDRESFPYADLRVDDDPSPLERLQALWDAYRPLADGFVSRAIDPDFDRLTPPPAG